MALYLYEHSSYIESAIGCWTWGPLSLLARLLFPFFFFLSFENCQLLKQILFYIMLSFFCLLFYFYFFSKTKNGKNKNKNTRDARPKNSFPLKPSPRKTLYRRRQVITLHQCKILTGQCALSTMVLVLLSLKWHCYLLPPVQPPEDKSRNFNHSFFLSSNHEEEAVFTLNFRSFSLYFLSLSF